MWKKVLFVCGIVLFIGGVGLTVYFVRANLLAIASTHEKITNSGAGGDPCFATSWNVNTRPVMSQDETQALTITAFQELGNCIDGTITLNAPGFNISPGKSERKLTITQGGKVNFGWILTPTQPGTFTIALEYTYDGTIDTKYIGISVTNVLGLNPFQMQLLSYIGTILGPVLTFAWWYDKWHEHKVRKEEKASLVNKTKTPARLKSKTNKKH